LHKDSKLRLEILDLLLKFNNKEKGTPSVALPITLLLK
jgi:hypothetical protein